MQKAKIPNPVPLSKENVLSAAFILAKALKKANLSSVKIHDENEIRRWLEDIPETGGWTTSIGSCDSASATLDLYYDYTANGKNDTIWFGFYAEKQAPIELRMAEYGNEVTRPKSLEWTKTDGFGHLKIGLTKNELRLPVYEGYGKGAYYFGIYDLTAKDGASFDVMRAIDFIEQSITSGKEFPRGTPPRIKKQISDRRGQPKFRKLLLKLYGNRCAVTNSRIKGLLEAAHIQPFSDGPADKPSNGILMRADIHTLFDLGLLWIEQDYTIRIARAIRSEYGDLDGTVLETPKDSSSRPSLAALKDHAIRFGHA